MEYLVCKMPKGTLGGGGQGQNHMGKICHGSKHSHQDGQVLYMGKGPKMSYKIQKGEDTPQDSQCADRR